jgi:hypothetical protein
VQAVVFAGYGLPAQSLFEYTFAPQGSEDFMSDHPSRGFDPARCEISQLRQQHRRLRDLASRLATAEDGEERTLLHLLHDAYGASRRTRRSLSFGLQKMLRSPQAEDRVRQTIDELLEQLLCMVPGGLSFRSRAALLREGLLRYIREQEGMMQLALRRRTQASRPA